ncbi:hypothetical protein VNO77_44322 [Canavalia gladiata]|uniref:Uncharacterized protein n=1 Tax=Canavalia gladiata TaxID=3824 RepID=A0AAN9JZH1_CANGL
MLADCHSSLKGLCSTVLLRINSFLWKANRLAIPTGSSSAMISSDNHSHFDGCLSSQSRSCSSLCLPIARSMYLVVDPLSFSDGYQPSFGPGAIETAMAGCVIGHKLCHVQGQADSNPGCHKASTSATISSPTVTS